MFSLAAGLARNNLLTKLFCAYPRFKMQRESIPADRIASFPLVHTAYMAAKRYGMASGPLERYWLRWDFRTYASFVAANLPEIDVFHGLSGHNLKPGLLAQRRGAKYICDRGSSHIDYQSRILVEEGERVGIPTAPIDPDFVEREVTEYAACDRIFVPSSFARRTFVAKGILDSKIWSFPYGVDLSRWRPLALPGDGVFRVVYLGALSVRKGIHDLLSAFKSAALPKSELVLIGSLTAESHHLLAGYRGMPNLILPGRLPHDKVLEWFARSSVFVLPSIEDGFGLVLMEAQACGLPVIATENTGGPDIIDNGRNGYLVPIRSPQMIAEKFVELHSNPALVASMRENALKMAQDVKGWDGFSHAMVARYAELCPELKAISPCS
jgi:glycosyltransferase involved in cell wall biosynthesis